MRPRINPWTFLARLLVFFALTYLAWQPVAPYYAQFLLRAVRVGLWFTEFSTNPLWQHPTQLLIVPQKSPTAIFYLHDKLFAQYQIPPQGIPAEWVMANLVLLVPLMLATPARTWRERFGKLGLALLVAVVLQVFDVVVGIKSFYSSTFRGMHSSVAAEVYQFLDAFVQSWDTQLFPFAIWAGINFRQILPERLFATARPAVTPPSQKPAEGSRAERRRRQRRS
jgi:hypothetical protein